jgi:hypothetical protein
MAPLSASPLSRFDILSERAEQHEAAFAVRKPRAHTLVPGERHGPRDGFVAGADEDRVRRGACVQDEARGVPTPDDDITVPRTRHHGVSQ